MPDQDFLSGVIEGFYGPPWSQAERFELFDWMANWRLNAYLYAPKDDLKHRTLWREPYSATEAEALGALVRASAERNIQFVYGLGPGLDIRYADDLELGRLRTRLDQMLSLGCQNFALLFDDIPDRMNANDRERWGSFASAQCHVANAMFSWTRERSSRARFFFCPTPYCGRMARNELGGKDYLATVGRDLAPEIEVFWTGPEIISREIDVESIRELEGMLRRKPVIWDNLFANDYDGRRLHCGPYAGRPPALRQAVRGLLVNPNNEFLVNYVPLRTLAEFVQGGAQWDPRQAYLRAMREWLPRFETVGQPVTLDDLILVGDCYYLPHQEGPEAEALYQGIESLLAAPPAGSGAEASAVRGQMARLRALCNRLTELRHRPLFYALNRRIWELREELELLEGYLDLKAGSGRAGASCGADLKLPVTCRGGVVARLQRLLEKAIGSQ